MRVTTLMHRLLVAGALMAVAPAMASDVDVAPIGEAVEKHLSTDGPVMEWVQDEERFEVEASDTIEMREVIADELETIKIANLVDPVRFESGVANIPDSTIVSLGEILTRMRDRRNVRLHLVGHADNRPLSPQTAAIYGDNAGLSRERAGQVAEHIQTALALPPESISYEWAGDTRPVASNLTEEGRALNRRVDDRGLVRRNAPAHRRSRKCWSNTTMKTVKVCRMETLCKLRYVDGHAKRRARAEPGCAAALRRPSPSTSTTRSSSIEQRLRQPRRQAKRRCPLRRLHGRRCRWPGRTERIYGDHLGLSRARARRVALAVQDALDLPTPIIESDGRGAERPLGSNADRARSRAMNRRVEVEFWYDDPLQDLPDEPQLCPEDAGADDGDARLRPALGIDRSNIDFSRRPAGRPAGSTLGAAPKVALADISGQDEPAAALRRLHAQRAPERRRTPPSTGTTSDCRPRAPAAPMDRIVAGHEARARAGGVRGSRLRALRTTSSTPASSRARHRTSLCRSCTTNSPYSTTTRASISRA